VRARHQGHTVTHPAQPGAQLPFSVARPRGSRHASARITIEKLPVPEFPTYSIISFPSARRRNAGSNRWQGVPSVRRGLRPASRSRPAAGTSGQSVIPRGPAWQAGPTSCLTEPRVSEALQWQVTFLLLRRGGRDRRTCRCRETGNTVFLVAEETTANWVLRPVQSRHEVERSA
jgi:hypothetical protein